MIITSLPATAAVMRALIALHEAIVEECSETWACSKCGTVIGLDERVTWLPVRIGPPEKARGYMYSILCTPCAVMTAPAGTKFRSMNLDELPEAHDDPSSGQ